MKHIILVISLFIGYCSWGQIPVSGTYNKGTVKIYRDEKAQMIYGNFSTCINTNKPCCNFNFKGRYKNLKDKKVAIETMWPEDSLVMQGVLICHADSGFTLKLKKLPGGSATCNDVDKSGYTVRLTQQRNWVGLTMIKPRKAYLYAAPDNEKRMNAYVTMYDVMGITNKKDGWVEGEYINYTPLRPVSTVGWLKIEDVFMEAFK